MSTVKSRLLQRLDADIAASADPGQAACLKVQRALLLARHGQMSEARAHLTTLHQQAFQHPHKEVGAWLHFAEGLMSYYTDFSSAAPEKVLHAQALAKAAKLGALEALCAAWLAQLAYVRHDLQAMIGHAAVCDRLAAVDHHAARYRLCTVMGLAHHLTGRVDAAQAWYSKARIHAMADGDEASLSALMYNTAQMRVAQVRRDSLSAGHAGDSGLLLGVDSIKNYDSAVGGSVRPDLTPILRAQILTVEGDFAEARRLLEEYLPQAMTAGLARLGSSLLADLAWCRVNTGQDAHALQQAKEAEAEVDLDPDCDVDDRAAAHSRLAQVYTALGRLDEAARHQASATASWLEFAEQQKAWAAALAELGLQPR
jgi:tetratricopeptide (TPR) repeat protein